VSEWSCPDLSDRTALVTGASRGVGRGVALALGEAGATVYVTGRSARDGERTEQLPGTVHDTAEEVTRRGGRGVALVCDHFDDRRVEEVFERIHRECEALDMLINNAWAGYERSREARFDAPFWGQPMWRWDLFAASLRAQYLASRLAAEPMVKRGRGLIVNVSFTDGDTYLGQVAYDVTKTASDRMAAGMAFELRKHGVAAVALHPGFVRTERVEAAWELLGSEPAKVLHSVEYPGRAVACLLADPDVQQLSGRRLAVGDLAEHYGFCDVDGRRPPRFRLEGSMTLARRMERLNRVVEKATTPA
jgi:NAD(P)-dependent dehydrogenase (short-subunit alcohol dehydrogenase family)